MEDNVEYFDAYDLRTALKMALDWIDAVPAETELPAMPGFDRDWVERLLLRTAQ